MLLKSNTEDWVLSIRVFIKDTLATSWQIRESKGKIRRALEQLEGEPIEIVDI